MFVFACSGVSVQAVFYEMPATPIDRLVKFSHDHLAKHPGDAEAHYNLARVHYLAFVIQRDEIPFFMMKRDEEGKPATELKWWALPGI